MPCRHIVFDIGNVLLDFDPDYVYRDLIPDPAERREPRFLDGDVPSPINPPEGCAFGHRVGHDKWEASVGMDLSLREVEPGHWVQPCPCCTDLA